MSTDEERKSIPAEEMEAELRERKEVLIENERDTQQDLNQGMQTGTHDDLRPGIKWGPSYRTRLRTGKPKKDPEDDK